MADVEALIEQLQLDVPWLDVPEHLVHCSADQVQAFFDTDGAKVPDPPPAQLPHNTTIADPASVVRSTPVVSSERLAGCVFLHGSGDTGEGIREWAKSVAPQLLSDVCIRFVFPTAPPMPYSLFGGAPSTVWFDRDELHPRAREDLKGLDRSCAIVHQHIDELRASGIKEANIFIVGFSQGGCLALHAGLRRPSVGGVFCMSSFLSESSCAYEHAKHVASTGRLAPGALVLTHGLQDPMVSPQWGQATAAMLTQCGVKSRFESYAGQHELTSAGLQLLHDWITEMTNRSKSAAAHEYPGAPIAEPGAADSAAVGDASDPDGRQCSSCGGAEPAERHLKRCACREALYCSKQCQRDAWGSHRAQHNALTAAHAAAEKPVNKSVDESAVSRVLGSEHEFACLELPVHQTPTTVIRAAYKRLSLAVHPDKNSDARAGEAFSKLFNAMEQLVHYQSSVIRRIETGSTEAGTDMPDDTHWWREDLPVNQMQEAFTRLEEFLDAQGAFGDRDQVDLFISMEEAVELHSQHLALFVDARDPKAFEASRVAAALSLPGHTMAELAAIATHNTLGLLREEQHKTIIVYSDNGSRLSRCINVTKVLQQASGIRPERVRRLAGGLNMWKQQRFATLGDCRTMFAGRATSNAMIT